ncbi:MAG: hypothetical protein QOG43_2250 [Actinomycetota bacterium]|jgi:SAM-dependent methyltransferase|nr:hypothetical protein [Actinomycetota bacterium]
MATFVPGVAHLTARHTGGSARYCYSVWLRHLATLGAHGLPTSFGTVGELGPGNSLGVGLAALLSGADRYVALDVAPFADTDRNGEVLDELIGLFRDRAPIPDEAEFPLVRPLLPSYAFPDHILTLSRMQAALAPDRLATIRQAVLAPSTPAPSTPSTSSGPSMITYLTRWEDEGVIAAGTADLVLSQAVLEYPDDLEATYAAIHRWLVPGGVTSHVVDFKAHGITREWNGHWACPDALWWLSQGRRRAALNRAPHSTHVELSRRFGFRLVTDDRTTRPSAIGRADLAPRFRHLTDEDLTTSLATMQAVKGPPPTAAGGDSPSPP